MPASSSSPPPATAATTIGGIDSPAVSPYVIAVGAHEMYDSSGAQDFIAPWSSGGNEFRQP